MDEFLAHGSIAVKPLKAREKSSTQFLRISRIRHPALLLGAKERARAVSGVLKPLRSFRFSRQQKLPFVAAALSASS
jgi:hypothetical protein